MSQWEMGYPGPVPSLATRRRFSHRYSQSTPSVLTSAIPLPSLSSSASSISSFFGATNDGMSSSLPTPCTTVESPFEYAPPKIVTDDRTDTDKMAVDQEDDVPTPKASPTRDADKSDSSIHPIYIASGTGRSISLESTSSESGASVISMTPTRPGSSSSTSYSTHSNDTDSTLTSARFRAARQKLRTSGSAAYGYHPSASASASEDDILHGLDSSSTSPLRLSPLAVSTLFERRRRAYGSSPSSPSSLFPSSPPSILTCSPPTLAKSLVSPVSVESPSTAQGPVPRMTASGPDHTTLADSVSVVVADIIRPKMNRGVTAATTASRRRTTPSSNGDRTCASCTSHLDGNSSSAAVHVFSARDATRSYKTSSSGRSPTLITPSPHAPPAAHNPNRAAGPSSFYSSFPTLPPSTTSSSNNKKRAARMLRSTLRDADAQQLQYAASSSKKQKRRHSHSHSSSSSSHAVATTHALPALKARLESVLIADAHAEAENGHFDSPSLEGSRRKGHTRARSSNASTKSGRARSSSRARSETGLLGWLWNSMTDDEEDDEDEEDEYEYGYDNVIFPFPTTAPPHIQAFSQTARSPSSASRPRTRHHNGHGQATPPRLRAQTQPAPSDVSRGFFSPFQGHSNSKLHSGGGYALSPSPPSPRPRHAFSLEAVPSMGDIPDMDKVELTAEAESLGKSLSEALGSSSVSTSSGFGVGTYHGSKTATSSRGRIGTQGTTNTSRSSRGRIPTPPPTPPLSRQYKTLNVQVQPPTPVSTSTSGSGSASGVYSGKDSPTGNRKRQSLDSPHLVRGSNSVRSSDLRLQAPQSTVTPSSLSSPLPSTSTIGQARPSTSPTASRGSYATGRRRPSTSTGIPSRHMGLGADSTNTGLTSPKPSPFPPSASSNVGAAAANSNSNSPRRSQSQYRRSSPNVVPSSSPTSPTTSSGSPHFLLPSPVSPSAAAFPNSATRPSSEFRSIPYRNTSMSAQNSPSLSSSNPVSTTKTTLPGLSTSAPTHTLTPSFATSPVAAPGTTLLPPSFNAHTASLRCRQIDGYVSFAAVGVAGLEEPIAENDADGDRYDGARDGAGHGGRRRGGSIGSGWKLGKLFGM